MASVTLSFDDGYLETSENVLPLLKKKKIPATFNIISDCIGKTFEGRQVVGWKDLERAIDLGMEVAFHTKTHQRLSSNLSGARKFLKDFPKNTSLQRLKDALKALLSRILEKREFDLEEELDPSELEERLNYKVVSFVYPGGHYNGRVKSLVKERYKSARSSDRGLNLKGSDRYALKCMVWTRNTTTEEANEWVEEAIKEDAWLIECFHLVGSEDNYKYFTPMEEFVKHLEYIKKKVDLGKIFARTQRDALRG